MSEVKPDTPKLCPVCGDAMDIPHYAPNWRLIGMECRYAYDNAHTIATLEAKLAAAEAQLTEQRGLVRDLTNCLQNRNADAHALCAEVAHLKLELIAAQPLFSRRELEAKLAAAEARARELEEGDEALLAVLPEDFGAVEYIKHLTAANAALEEKLGEAEGVLRGMASYVGNGGYNAGTVDSKVFEAKIREGIDSTIRVEVNRALSDADTRAHAWWRHTGPHKSLREAIHNGTPAWVRDPEASRKKGAEYGE